MGAARYSNKRTRVKVPPPQPSAKAQEDQSKETMAEVHEDRRAVVQVRGGVRAAAGMLAWFGWMDGLDWFVCWVYELFMRG